MKILEKIKYIIIGIIIGLGFVGIGAYASVAIGGGQLGSLFKKIGQNYKLVGTNIKNNSITATQIGRHILDSSNIKDKSIESSNLADNINVSRCKNNELLGGDGKCHNKSRGNIQLTEEEVAKIINDNQYLKNENETDPQSLKINGNITKKSGYLKIGDSYLHSARGGNMIKIGDGDHIKIGEWEQDDKLSIYAKNGVNITGNKLTINSDAVIQKNTYVKGILNVSKNLKNIRGNLVVKKNLYINGNFNGYSPPRGLRNCSWSSYINGAYKTLDYKCPNGKILAGENSNYISGTYDRKYRFYCCNY